MYISNQIKDPKPSETLPTAYMQLSSSHGTSLQINLENYQSIFFFIQSCIHFFFKWNYILQENTISFLLHNFTYISMCYLQSVMSEIMSQIY